MQRTPRQFLDHVIPASQDYLDAEIALSRSFRTADVDPKGYRVAQLKAIRNASHLAIALFSLVDRASIEAGCNKRTIRDEIDAGCLWNGYGVRREGAESRVRSVADAYKHHDLDGPGHTLASADAVLACGLKYGLDGFGVGKFGAPEVIMTDKDGRRWKFAGDAHVVLRSWKAFLDRRGVDMSNALIPF